MCRVPPPRPHTSSWHNVFQSLVRWLTWICWVIWGSELGDSKVIYFKALEHLECWQQAELEVLFIVFSCSSLVEFWELLAICIGSWEGSHSGSLEEFCIQGCNDVFHSSILPSSSWFRYVASENSRLLLLVTFVIYPSTPKRRCRWYTGFRNQMIVAAVAWTFGRYLCAEDELTIRVSFCHVYSARLPECAENIYLN
jgi:hypothetical protein